jgi:hypothetical protein
MKFLKIVVEFHEPAERNKTHHSLRVTYSGTPDSRAKEQANRLHLRTNQPTGRRHSQNMHDY